jgi:ATP-binding cassette, subfamily B, bacterial PglK
MIIQTYINIFNVLEARQKLRVAYFGIFVVTIMILETFSLGMFYPFLQSITNNVVNSKLSELLLKFNDQVNLNLDIELTALLIFTVIIVIKNFFIYFFDFWQLTLLRDLRIDFKTKILKKHFEEDYEKVSNIKTSTYIRDFNETIEVFIKTLQNIMLLIVEFFVFIGLVSLLIFIQSSEIIYFVLIIGLIATIFTIAVKNILKNYGAQTLYLRERTMSKLLDILNSTKEILMFKKSSIFTKQFKKIEFKALNINRNVNMIQKFPKIFFEILVVVGFTIYIFIMSFNNQEINKLIPQLGIFFLATIRIMPAVSKIVLYANKLKYAEISALKIANDIRIYNEIFSKKIVLEKIKFNKSIEIKNVSFNYKNRDKQILNNVNLFINKGDYIGIFGPSGGGKSTLIDILSGLLIPSNGEILIDDKVIQNLKSTLWIDKIGYLTQDNNLLDESILTNITLEFNEDKIDKNLFNDVCQKTGLIELIDNLPEKFETKVGENGFAISGGEKQRIGIARLLYAKKEILIFDESTSNLDEKNKTKIISTINDLSSEKTILIISHDKDVINNCNKKFIVENRRLKQLN